MQNTPSSAGSKRSASLLPLIVAVVVPVIAVAAALYVVLVNYPQRQNQEMNRQTMQSVVGLANPVNNSLAPQFTDANGDLVADVPTDGSKLIDPPTLLFSYIASDDAPRYKQTWASFTEHLSKVTGKPVEYVLLTSTDDQLRALRDGGLHVTGLNTGSVPVAVNLTGFVPVAQLGGASGATDVRTALIVPADSEIKDVRGLVGKTLTVTEPNSNSGYKAPIVLLKDFGLNLVTDFDIRNSGTHEASIEGIAKKEYEVAAVATDMLERAESTGKISKGQYRVVYNSESFPAAGMGYVYNLKPELAEKIRQAIQTFQFGGTSLEKEFASSRQDRFIPVDYKRDWQLIRRIDNEIGRQHKIMEPESQEQTGEEPTTQEAN